MTEKKLTLIKSKLKKADKADKSRWNPEEKPEKQGHIIRHARTLFLQDYPYSTIYVITGIPYKIFFRKQNSWFKLKEKLDDIILKEVREKAISERAETFVFKGLDLAEKYLDRIMRQGYQMDAKDFKLIMDSISNVHRIRQLETGKATNITKQIDGLSPEELLEYVKALKNEITADHSEILTYENVNPNDVLDKLGEDVKH